MMTTHRNKDGKIQYIGSHKCCCGRDNKNTKKDDDGYYLECSCCGLRSKSINDGKFVLHSWNIMMREIFSHDNNYGIVEKCCDVPDKKLMTENGEYWYKCKICGYESKKGPFTNLLLNWNQDLKQVNDALRNLLK